MGGDFFGTPPVRYIGYSFAFWEAMKGVLRTQPEKTFYAVGALFIVLHAFDRALLGDSLVDVMMLVDTLIFDAIATVIIPRIVARGVLDVSTHYLSEWNVHYHVTEYGPSFVAIASVLLLSAPLDRAVDQCMMSAIRPHYP